MEKVPISFHEPYYKAEHSEPAGTEAYQRTMQMLEKTIHYGEILNCRYIVYHHNNGVVRAKTEKKMKSVSCENFLTAEKLCGAQGIPLLVENAGVLSRNNMLFDQKEFIELCKKEDYQVLLDIGHAQANGWNPKWHQKGPGISSDAARMRGWVSKTRIQNYKQSSLTEIT